MSQPCLDLVALRRIVESISRRRHHPGHTRLDFDELVSEGLMLAAKLMVENPSIPQPNFERLLRSSFENKIIDLRREYCLNRSHGARTLQMSAIRNESGQEKEFSEGLDVFGDGVRFSSHAENYVDCKNLVKEIMRHLHPEFYPTFQLMLQGEGATDISQRLNKKLSYVKHCIGNVRLAAWRVLYNRDDQDFPGEAL